MDRPNTARTSLLSPQSPTASAFGGGRRISVASHTRRRNNTVTSSKYVTLIPGAEPGLAPENQEVDLHAQCGITVVDFDEERILQTELENESLLTFLEEERPEWSKVRWINVNGLSWDCISAVAKKWNLHRLAIEDLLNTSGRTKCDWYSDHAFINLAMLKLIHAGKDEEDDYQYHLHHQKSFLRKLIERKEKPRPRDTEQNGTANGMSTNSSAHPYDPKYKSLQRYHGGSMNTERVAFMEKHTSLVSKKMTVSVEQVSIFLTADGSVISFFENSADDVEPPILARLGSQHTVLRSSCDASMIVQAIIDTIIDLSFPVIHAYQDQKADLEISVLTDPNIQHTTALYILTSELSLLQQTLAPVVGLINSLRGHKLDPKRKLPNGSVYGVEVSETGKTYLADVEDHTVMLIEQLETMKRGADNMIDLIFNTVSSLQNESMKKLTLITILFLPLTFLTGYFGMNFDVMVSVQKHSEMYFWKIAAPLMVATATWLLWKPVIRGLIAKSSKRTIKKKNAIRVKAEAKQPLVKRQTWLNG
ncbi:hypothetical protein DFH27DRAFT_589067 [Peziza echinospora]|nr:hypothetical protein DFH27DRAFT_589067 [Peziza echinospora]